MGYSFESRVRFSEAGEDGRLTLPSVIDYFQDCCMFQTDSIRQGQRDLLKRNRMWVISGMQIIIHRFPEEGEHIVTTTMPYRLRGIVGLRNHLLQTREGEILAEGDSQFTFLDSTTGLPAKLTPEDLEGYVLDEKLPTEFPPRKILLPSVMEAKEPFTVQIHNLDANRHVNNCEYVRMALDLIPKGTVIRTMRAEYKMQGKLGDIICPKVGAGEGRTVISLDDQAGKPYAVVELQQQ